MAVMSWAMLLMLDAQAKRLSHLGTHYSRALTTTIGNKPVCLLARGGEPIALFQVGIDA